jgi:hypothetical protein
MKKHLSLFLLFIPLNFIISQVCFSGDCENGYGVKKYADATYSGFWVNGSQNGLGLLKYTNDDAYVGEFKNKKFNGDGAFFKSNNEKYFGEFKVGMQNGIGVYQSVEGNSWAYYWKDSKPGEQFTFDEDPNNPPNCTGNCVNGYGKLDGKDGEFIQAIFENGIATYGQIFTASFVYMGYIKNKQPEGFGIMATKEGKFFGYFKEGVKHGLGITVNTKEEVSGDRWNRGKVVRVNLDAANFKNQLKQLLDLSIEDIKTNEIDRTIPKDSVNDHLTLKKNFLNNYAVTYKQQPYAKDKMVIKFPNYGPNKITEEQIKTLLNQCEFLTKEEESNYDYNYKEGKKVRPMLPFLVNNYLLLRIEYPHIKN